MKNNNVCSAVALRSCTGCGVCATACPKGAVTIEENEDGFYSPVVAEDKCIDCSLCLRSCYKFDAELKTVENENHKCFAAVNKDKTELATSSSGGVSIELMRECIRLGYFVAGVVYDNDSERAVTRIARSESELEQFKGSKYFQSYTEDAFKEALTDVTPQKYAIFGTPCQIYAFHKAVQIKKNSEKYIFVDIFCHGCPSIKLWDSYLAYEKEKQGVSSFDKIDFRSKTQGWHEYCMDFTAGEKKVSSSKYNDPFYELFFGMDVMNDACYDCIARSTVSYTDIRIGDFWGKRYNSDTRGVSAVVLSTEKGERLWGAVADRFDISDADFSEIVRAQSYKKTHIKNEKRRNSTLSMLKNGENITVIVKKRRKMLPFKRNLKRNIKSALKHLPSSLYARLRKALG